MRTTTITLLTCLLVNQAFSQIIHIPTDQPTIQSGLNEANSGDTVLVAPGIYFESIVWPNVSGIKLIAEGDTSDTYIDGGGQDRVILIQGSVVDSLTLIEGFTIQNGRGIGTPSGSGILCESSGVSINECRITKCEGSIGCGMAFTNSVSVIRNSTISKNIGNGAYVGGVGIFMGDHSLVEIRTCEIVDNFTDTCTKVFGSGIYLSDHSELRAYHSEFSRNVGTVGFSFSESRGIGIYSHFSSKIELHNCKINNNGSYGQAEYVMGVAINSENGIEVKLEGCEIIGNSSETISNSMSGIITVIDGTCSVSDILIANNTLNLQGGSNLTCGMVYVSGNLNADRLIVRDNLITTNVPNTMAATSILRFNGYYPDSYCRMTNSLIVNNNSDHSQIDEGSSGLVIVKNLQSASIVNATIADNMNLSSETMAIRTLIVDTTSIDVVNSILHNPNLQSEIQAQNATVEYCNVRSGVVGIGNIDADPKFMGNGDYHLQTFSPCINSGTATNIPSTDLEGNPRPVPIGTNPDMGAYEDDNPSTSVKAVMVHDPMLHPNPTSGIVWLRTDQPISSVEVFNTQGQLVYRESSIHGNSLDISGFDAGLYVIRIFLHSSDTFNERILLQK